MLEELFNTYEKLKKYIYIIKRKNNKSIMISFTDDKFYHLVGLHKLNLEIYFPKYLKSKKMRYKFIKKNIKRFDRIISDQLKSKDRLSLRMITFNYIIKLLDDENTKLYDLSKVPEESLYKGDYDY